jgi:phospholipid transport system substrate-binding protein
MPHLDMHLASRLVLGRHWQDASAVQRDAFVDGLRRLLIRIFAAHIGDYHDAEVEYFPTIFNGDRHQRATVRTRVSRGGSPEVSVDYRLYLTDNGWKVYDVAIFGVSLVKTYHITIDSDVEKLGLDGVIEQINAKVPLHGPHRGAGSERAAAG